MSTQNICFCEEIRKQNHCFSCERKGPYLELWESELSIVMLLKIRLSADL